MQRKPLFSNLPVFINNFLKPNIDENTDYVYHHSTEHGNDEHYPPTHPNIINIEINYCHLRNFDFCSLEAKSISPPRLLMAEIITVI